MLFMNSMNSWKIILEFFLMTDFPSKQFVRKFFNRLRKDQSGFVCEWFLVVIYSL